MSTRNIKSNYEKNRRQQIKANPEKYAEYQKREHLRYMRRRHKLNSSISEQVLKERWRINSRNYYYKNKRQGITHGNGSCSRFQVI